MFAPGPIRPISISLNPAQGTQTAVFRPGHTLQGTVQGQPGSLALQVANTRVPLDAGVPLQPGQSVLVEVHATQDGVQLRIAPRPDAAQTAAPSTSGQLAPVLTSILENMDLLQQAGAAAQLMPAKLPPVAEAVRALLNLFTQKFSLGGDLQRILTLARQAVAAGALPEGAIHDLETLVEQGVARDADSVENVLRQWVGKAGGSVEGRMARALADGGVDEVLRQIRADLRFQLSQLRGNDNFTRFLREIGQLRDFNHRVDQLFERLSGGDAQNVRALSQPYLFVQVPFAADAPIRHAQVHFFGEQAGSGRRYDKANAMVALDLSTTELGDLWIVLRITHGRCYCTIRTTNETALEALSAASPELQEALGRAGYPEAVVQTEPWQGDRIAEVAALVRRFSGLDVEA